MRTTKQIWLRATAVFTLALCLSLGLNAFAQKAEVKPSADPDPVTVYFKLKSNLQADLEMADNWSDSPVQECDGPTYLCEITYDASLYPTLQDFLDANPTRQDIIDHALAYSFKN